MFLIANTLEGKAYKQQKLTLHNKKTYFILVFVELNPCKVSSLDILGLKNWIIIRKTYFKDLFLRADYSIRKTFQQLKLTFLGKTKDLIDIWYQKRQRLILNIYRLQSWPDKSSVGALGGGSVILLRCNLKPPLKGRRNFTFKMWVETYFTKNVVDFSMISWILRFYK